jgi:phage terminase large subunit GpA-like protein
MPPDAAAPTPALPADAWSILADAAHASIPAAGIGVDEWAAANRWVGGARAGRWNNATAPYLVAPMRALADRDVILVGPGRCGKTAVAENWLLQSIDADPGPFGWYLNTDDIRAAYVKGTINPMLEMHDPAIGAKRRYGPTDDSLSYKRFRDMAVEFLVATDSNLRNKGFRKIFGDEVDGYDPGFGDAKEQFDVRRAQYGADSRLLLASHPDLAVGLRPDEWRRGIMSYYAASSRGTWWWPCRKCGGFSSPNPGTERHAALAWRADAPIEAIAADAHILCPLCEARLDDADRLAMNAEGVWIHHGESIDENGRVTGERAPNPMAGFWIVGAMSPFLLNGIGGLATARARAERNLFEEDEGEDATLGRVLSKQWGFPLILPKIAGAADVTSVAERTRPEMRLGQVPEGVRFITAAIDVQASRFELMFRGFGPGMESWIIDIRRIAAEPAYNPDEWDAVLRLAQSAEFPLMDGSGRVMRVRAVGYDSGGEAGVTGNAYDAWRRARARRAVRALGRMSNRECWNLLPLKGASSKDASRLIISYPDGGKKDRFATTRGDVPLGIFNGVQFKDALAAQLGRAEPGPPALHIPAALRGPWPADPRPLDAPHRWIEQLFAERRQKDGSWDKITPSARNEALDLAVMTHVMAHLHASRIDWARPPAWCAEWDRNSMISTVRAPDTRADRPAVESDVSTGVIAATPPATLPPPPVRAPTRSIGAMLP